MGEKGKKQSVNGELQGGRSAGGSEQEAQGEGGESPI